MIVKNKKLRYVALIGICIAVLAAGIALFLNYYKMDFNKKLPMTVMVDKSVDLEGVAYKFWFNLVKPSEDTAAPPWEELTDVRFNSFQLLAGDKKDFAVEATFWVKPQSSLWSVFDNWGDRQDDGTIQNIHWTMRIKNTGKNTYTLTKIEETTNTVAGLGSVKQHYQKEAGVKVPDENCRYLIENGSLKVTYDNGKNWRTVPVQSDALFAGDYSGPKDTLIPGSFLITPQKTAFVFVEKETQTSYPDKEKQTPYLEKVKVIFSTNKGATWKESNIPGTFPSVRIRQLGFTSEKNGYFILTSDRTMSFEANAVYKTSDGGNSWALAGSVKDVTNLVKEGGFVNDQLGFISFGTINVMDKPPRPFLFRTADGGRNWNEVEVPIPPEYQGIFVSAQTPVFDGSQGTLLVDQGPSGDFQGGKVMARFISIDEGVTWHFSNLVDPDQVLSK